MSANLKALQDSLDLRTLVAETRTIDRHSKVRCPNPAHEDRNPSCHIWSHSFKCFSCGLSGDLVDWLELEHGISTGEAIQELKRRVEGIYRSPSPQRRVSRTAIAIFKQVPANQLAAHRRRAARLDHLPRAMGGRGFALKDLQQLGFAAFGEDAVFPITGPDGTVLALKKRFAKPQDDQRYRYTTPGHGTPAWCSPCFLERGTILIVEGELNAMVCFLAAPHLAVMGVAGTGGALHSEALRSRKVYVYADGDEPGQRARNKWAAQALEVYILEPWPADACEIAGRRGHAALRERLT